MVLIFWHDSYFFLLSQLDETLLERLWGLTEMFPESLRSAAEVSAQSSLSVAKKLYRWGAGSCMLQLKPYSHINSETELIWTFQYNFFHIMLSCSFSRSALWVGTTSFIILVLPVVFETERLQLEQQQLQQQRQVSSTNNLNKYKNFPCNVILG